MPWTPGEEVSDEVICPGLTRALRESLAADPSGHTEETPEQSRLRRLKAASKRLKQIEALEVLPLESLDSGQRAKLARRGETEAVFVALPAAAEAAAVAETSAAAAAAAAQAEALARLSETTQKVVFDDAFACPICTEPLEAATLALPCRHAFCRACLEQVAWK